MKRPQFEDLPPEYQRLFGNGVGPRWFPAGWRHHDFGYAVGGDRWDRARADWKFLTAMLRDALHQCALLILPAIMLAVIFFIAVRAGGQFNSFRYRKRYATIDEILGFQSR